MTSVETCSLADTHTLERPFEYFALLREHAPVHFDQRAYGWLITRYDDLVQAARMTEAFSNELGFAAMRSEHQDELDEMMRREGFGPHIIADNFQVDPPLHKRRRALVEAAFGGHQIAALQGSIETIVNDLIDGFIDAGEADLVAEFAIPVAIYVISEMLDVPRARAEDVKRWSDAAVVPLGRGISRDEHFAYARQIMDMHRFLADQFERRRSEPGPGMISSLVNARIDDPDSPQLSFGELLSCCVALLAAGNETTRNSIAFGAAILASRPDLLHGLQQADDQSRAVQRFVEEVLRFEPPVPQLPRLTTRDVEIGGVTIPAGQHVFLCWASGNRDPAKFEHPDVFDPARKTNGQHLSFGHGAHRCIGAMLARMEMRCAFTALVSRVKSLTLVEPGNPVDIWGTFVFRGPRRLPVRFERA